MLTKVRKKNFQDKLDFAAKLTGFLQEYPVIMTFGCDNISTVQIQEVRRTIRGKGELLFGKNTIIRKTMRKMAEGNPNLQAVVPYVRGNIGLAFTKDHLLDVKNTIQKSSVPAAAKPGMTANCDVFLEKGPTGLEPTKTAFLQALNIATKINKGQVEILNDVHLITEGDKVGSSQAALCTMLGIKPFSYNFELGTVYDDGQIYDASALNVTVDEIFARFHAGVATVAALSLATGIPTVASFPHSILNGYKNLLAIALETEYSFEGVDRLRDMLANPDAYAAPVAAGSGAVAEAVKEKTPTPEESSDDGMGFSFFDSD
eukprot:TRINITY_DN49_c0_g1_i1.p1 TRINITY_DN49_c0_g1~~TRINITY_DN49_c0_g1_i1.p1  ORF type:complete len:326 (-),score=79.02 TRINITY_DN49_c0_g1_i1:60-1010(-)